MDYQEAIEYMRKELHKQCVNSEGQDAYIIAISAMQELQMYKDAKLCLIPEDVYAKQCDELDGYKQLGTLEEIRETMERQKDYKPIIYRLSTFGVPDEYLYCCPNCEYRIIKKDYRGFYSGPRTKYCPNCGQRLEWEE